MTSQNVLAAEIVRYRVTGMDCPSCAAKIEGASRKVPGVADVKVSIASQEIELHVSNQAARLPEVERTIEGLGYQLARISSDDKIPDLSHVTPAYKRALWIVVLLNLGYGVIEIIGGFIAGSQALKADALDFIGDGLISWIGLLVADGFDIDSGTLGDCSDRHHDKSLAPVVATGCSLAGNVARFRLGRFR